MAKKKPGYRAPKMTVKNKSPEANRIVRLQIPTRGLGGAKGKR